MNHQTLVLAIIAAAACTQSQESAAPTAPEFSAGGQIDQTSRARYTWADSVNAGSMAVPQWVPAGWRGDDRQRDGNATVSGTSNEYQGSFCGVWANINSGSRGGNGDFDATPDRQWTASLPVSCQPSRYYRIYLNGMDSTPGITRPHTIFSGIETMALGQIRIQPFRSGTLDDLGVGLWFDDAYPPANNVLVTRLPNVIDEFGRSVRQWRVETRGSHRAMGAVLSTSKKGGTVPTGTTYYLPFVLTVTEVPYPYPTYP